jgi:hypothetical protein
VQCQSEKNRKQAENAVLIDVVVVAWDQNRSRELHFGAVTIA